MYQNSGNKDPNTSKSSEIIVRLALTLIFGFSFAVLAAQSSDTVRTNTSKSTPWYQNLNIRGYAQLRYNKLFETNPDLKCDQCDKSWGGEESFFFRRIRVVLYGQVHERVYVYIQPDFASSTASGTLNFGQIRDAYFDVGIDKQNAFRFRIGQSKVPYGFENLQSSQNRIPLDRNDALNSAIPNERDIGIFFYWAPKEIRTRFSQLVSTGLKGSGDYGVVGFGVFNGQTANRNDANGKPHVVARLSYPFLVGNKQFIEPGLQVYKGNTVVTSRTSGVTGVNPEFEYKDQRAAASVVVYPQPFGFTAEYNVGTGPEYNPATNAIEQEDLKGGYMMASYLANINKQILIPFARYQFYDGGKKHERDARSYTVREFEAGIEWQPMKNFEFVAMYTVSERRFEDGTLPVNAQEGSLLRLQLQVNF